MGLVEGPPHVLDLLLDGGTFLFEVGATLRGRLCLLREYPAGKGQEKEYGGDEFLEHDPFKLMKIGQIDGPPPSNQRSDRYAILPPAKIWRTSLLPPARARSQPSRGSVAAEGLPALLTLTSAYNFSESKKNS